MRTASSQSLFLYLLLVVSYRCRKRDGSEIRHLDTCIQMLLIFNGIHTRLVFYHRTRVLTQQFFIAFDRREMVPTRRRRGSARKRASQAFTTTKQYVNGIHDVTLYATELLNRNSSKLLGHIPSKDRSGIEAKSSWASKLLDSPKHVNPSSYKHHFQATSLSIRAHLCNRLGMAPRHPADLEQKLGMPLAVKILDLTTSIVLPSHHRALEPDYHVDEVTSFRDDSNQSEYLFSLLSYR
ncbi:hypothetical protein F5Y12DRAFT_714817 [Xylaria sp. FL1777]|nr:hypothetical protein F5Y12DRAFT_714817 [Xylaria sp. FL1777]